MCFNDKGDFMKELKATVLETIDTLENEEASKLEEIDKAKADIREAEKELGALQVDLLSIREDMKKAEGALSALSKAKKKL